MNILTKRLLKQVINEEVNKTFYNTGINDVNNYKKEITIKQLRQCFDTIIKIVSEEFTKELKLKEKPLSRIDQMKKLRK